MSRPRSCPAWQLQALAAHRRDEEIRKAEEQQKVAHYFETNTNASKHHEQWTAEEYYKKANKDAELLSEQKLKAAQLEERRKRLELMLFKENMQYQQELKSLASQPKYFKNGSYLNNVPTSTLEEINQGIMAKEEALRRQEAELRLYHAWRMSQPEIRAAQSYMAHGKLKSAWTQQIVEREIQKKKEEEETRKSLQERDESLRKQIKMEEQKLKEKEFQMKELRNSLESQIAEMYEKEKEVNKLRKQEEYEQNLLEQLKFISNEREGKLARLVAEREAMIINMGLHKYKLKQKVLCVLKEIALDIEMMEKVKEAVLKETESQQEKCVRHKRVLDEAFNELKEHRERERQRQINIDAMFDGEARMINEKQDKMWEREREARAFLMTQVLSALAKQIEDKIEFNRQQQRENVLEREKILEDMEKYHSEVKVKEKEKVHVNSACSNMNTLQTELSRLKTSREKLESLVSEEARRRADLLHERALAHEITRPLSHRVTRPSYLYR